MMIRLPTHICVIRPQWVNQRIVPLKYEKLKSITFKNIYFRVQAIQNAIVAHDFLPVPVRILKYESTKTHLKAKLLDDLIQLL